MMMSPDPVVGMAIWDGTSGRPFCVNVGESGLVLPFWKTTSVYRSVQSVAAENATVTAPTGAEYGCGGLVNAGWGSGTGALHGSGLGKLSQSDVPVRGFGLGHVHSEARPERG